jgi:glycosyltransferase involved in cell wall biosynthesis
VRLGVYADVAYRCQDGVHSSGQAFVGFVSGLADHVDELVLFGRVDPRPGRSHYIVDPRVRFVALPHYPRVTDVGGQLRVGRATARRFGSELARLDAVWVFGPHPIALVVALRARRSRTPLVLGVRQDYPAYIAGRVPGRRWFWAPVVARGLDAAFRRLARTAPTVALGDEIARAYAAGPAPVLSTGFSLVAEADILEPGAAGRPWGDPRRLLTVGRLDPEKNPLLLADILAGLRRRDPRWRLTVVGDGPLAGALGARAADVGVADVLELRGYVPQGDELRAIYRAHDAFLHVSRTEGLPQVLFEAQAAGLPVVATAVGGVRAALGPTSSGLLIPPDDTAAAVDALTAMADDPGLRHRLAERGLALARSNTREAQSRRIVAFIAEATDGYGSRSPRGPASRAAHVPSATSSQKYRS